MKILKARHLGMCFGVRDAIVMAQTEARRQPLTILGELVHNETVLESLRNQGVRIAESQEEAMTHRVMITAHGAADITVSQAREAGFSVVEATCPLVRAAHRALASLVGQGYHPVIIGKRGHVEVRGLAGDFPGCDVVLSNSDVDQIVERPGFGVISQTTQPLERVRQLVARLRTRFLHSEVRFVDTVCQPTKQRQSAAAEIACQSDIVIVIGGMHSNNTRELVESCGQYCSNVRHVQTAADLQPAWFQNTTTVGVTAGTSTPDNVIDEVERWLVNLAVPFSSAVPCETAQIPNSVAHHAEVV